MVGTECTLVEAVGCMDHPHTEEEVDVELAVVVLAVAVLVALVVGAPAASEECDRVAAAAVDLAR